MKCANTKIRNMIKCNLIEVTMMMMMNKRAKKKLNQHLIAAQFSIENGILYSFSSPLIDFCASPISPFAPCKQSIASTLYTRFSSFFFWHLHCAVWLASFESLQDNVNISVWNMHILGEKINSERKVQSLVQVTDMCAMAEWLVFDVKGDRQRKM